MPARGGLEVEPTTRPRPYRDYREGVHDDYTTCVHRQAAVAAIRAPPCVWVHGLQNDVKCGARNHRHTARGVNVAGPVPIGPVSASDTFTRHSMIVPFTVHQNPHSTLLLPPRTTAPQGVHRDAPRHTVIIHRFQIVAVVHLHATVDTFSLSLRLPAGTHDPTPHSPGEPQCRSV